MSETLSKGTGTQGGQIPKGNLAFKHLTRGKRDLMWSDPVVKLMGWLLERKLGPGPGGQQYSQPYSHYRRREF